MGVVGVATVLLVPIIILVGLYWLVARRPRPDSRTARVGAEIVRDVPATPAAAALLRRWRDRSARWRLVGAVPAALLATAASIATRQEVLIGIDAAPLWTRPVPIALLAACAGAFAAELHAVRGPAPRRRAASLQPRELATELPAGWRLRWRVLVALCAVAAAIAVPALGIVRALPGLAALAVLLLLPAVQGRIVARVQPVMAADLAAADRAVRRLAIRAVDGAACGAAVLLLAAQSVPLGEALDRDSLGVLLAAGQLAAIVLTVVWWRRSAPHRLLPDVDAVLASRRVPAKP